MQRQALTVASPSAEMDGGTHDMGICLGQAQIAISPFCPFVFKIAPSDEDSSSCEVLAGLIQSLIAISNVKYALTSKLPLR